MQQKRFTSCAGSALVEFAILIGVLLPVGLGIAMIGKMTDLRQTNEQASRYATWEPTVYSRSDLLSRNKALVEKRFFGLDTVTINSGDAGSDSAADADSDEASQNILWGSASRETEGLRELASVSLDSEQSVTPDYKFDTGKSQAAKTAGEVVAVLGSAFDELSGNSWGIVADGLLRTEVDLAVNATGFLRAAGGDCSSASAAGSTGDTAGADKKVCLDSAGVILADGWSASGDAQAASRVRSLVPSSGAEKIGEGLSYIGVVPIFDELDDLDGAFGHVDMSVLPEYAKP